MLNSPKDFSNRYHFTMYQNWANAAPQYVPLKPGLKWYDLACSLVRSVPRHFVISHRLLTLDSLHSVWCHAGSPISSPFQSIQTSYASSRLLPITDILPFQRRRQNQIQILLDETGRGHGRITCLCWVDIVSHRFDRGWDMVLHRQDTFCHQDRSAPVNLQTWNERVECRPSDPRHYFFLLLLNLLVGPCRFFRKLIKIYYSCSSLLTLLCDKMASDGGNSNESPDSSVISKGLWRKDI